MKQATFEDIRDYCTTHGVPGSARGNHTMTIFVGFSYNPKPVPIVGADLDSIDAAAWKLARTIYRSTFYRGKLSRIIHP
jgi:hypothetical protein